ncbi:MAG: hypothetical protein Q9212_006374 [Teloschistes hypoglaucus]
MPLGGSHGPRPGKVADKEREKSRLPIIGLSRKSSVTSATSTSTKAPSSTSWFSRGRRKQETAPPPLPTPTIPSTTSRNLRRPSDAVSSRSEPLSRTRQPESVKRGPSSTLDLGVRPPVSTAATHVADVEGRRVNTLRRKPSLINQHGQYARTEASLTAEGPQHTNLKDWVSSPDLYAEPTSESVFGVPLPAISSSSSSYLPTRNVPLPDQATSSSHMANYNALRAPKTPTPQLVPPLAPSFATSSGSSTRRSESPGSFSRTSTPTSVSSYSPGIPVTTKSPLRTRHISPTNSRPPVTRHWPGNSSKQDLVTSDGRGLSVVQELATSSSSSDTVRGIERLEKASQGRRTPQKSTRQAYSPLIGPEDQSLAKGPASSNSDAPAAPFAVSNHDSFSHVAFSASQIPAKTPPPRPSREGTPHLDDVVLPSPVIRSNLSRLETSGHKRRESLENPPFFSGSIGESPSSDHPLRSIKSSRLPSPSLAAGGTSRTWPAETTHSRVASRAGSRDRSFGRGQESSPITPSVSKSPSRFGLFSRRTSPVRSTTSESVGKSGKKGPAAGTGHEGYGKYARRGRSGSAGTSASRGRSTSSNGTTSSVTRTPDSRDSSFTSREGAEIDDFLRDRLTPVVISGGKVSHDRNSGTEFYRTTSGASSSSLVSSDASSLTRPQDLESRTIRKMEGSSMIPFRRESRTLIQGSENINPASNDDVDSSTRPTLAARRSLHRSRLLKDEDTVRAPAPINTRSVAPSPAMNTNDSTQSGPLRTGGSSRLTDDISEGREGNWLKSKKAERPSKSPSKWNFFQRANAAQKPSGRRPSEEQERPEELPVAITRLPQARSVPHYAMIDNNGQDVDDPEGLIPNLQDFQIHPASERVPPVRRHEHKESMLLPSPPTMAGEFTNIQGPPSPKILLRHPPPMPQRMVQAPSPTEPRLQQVGRIPRVVSKRDRPHKPPPQSFSRPFVRDAALEPGHIAVDSPEVPSYAADRPILGIQTEVIPSNVWGDPYSGKPASAPARAPSHFNGQGGDEFLIIPQRHNSQASGSSTSGALSFVLAATEGKGASQQFHEEDVWKEYDDFLDTVESPAPLPMNPFEATNKRNSSSKTRMTPAPLQIRKGSSSSTHSNSAQELPPMTLAPTSALPSPPSRMTLLSPNLASSPMSFSDFIAGYGDRNRASTISKRQSSVSGSRYSQASVHSTLSETEQKRHTQIMAEKTRNSSSSQSNLRFSALMTSRWLSFGRVLFSPAHDEIQTTKQDRVLVLDGLGNDDWSFYCALTYPDATVYNLSSFKRMASASVRKRELGSVQSPPNHRQIFHAGMSAPFPFPKGYFSVAVFRFPAATTETAYYNAVSECKRVLRPGGYLEVSILDLDMVNMGNRARRAVRRLKENMQGAQTNVSLKPVSDNIQKMLGRRGFENLNRCMVTVPVAGLVPDSRAGSLDERDLSLGDMLKDHSTQGDESITKMVSRVGRWWYTRCYEHAILPDEGENSDGSIWADRQLLKECEKHETGIKLLICYAQKPERSKRRTISL